MTIWYVHRRANGTIASAHQEMRLGYAEEELNTDTSPELVTFLTLPPAIDQADLDNIEKSIKAMALVMAQWSGKTVPQLKAAYRTAHETLN